ncbi:hypothetical protein E2C01_056680 [Portunus trituberculatus]|uniref:Uncharacterized protein n=1 Tax=Portunus trituberculatus TaxID=210409 RepID=A0A5B7GY39_PORTR|nr:hypothetical protein [Portunus trituberculatus]
MGCDEHSIKASCDLTEHLSLCLRTQGGSHSLLSKASLLLHTKIHAFTTHTHISLQIKNKNVPKWNCSLGSDPKYFDTTLHFFFINFCNICNLRSNFQ